MTSIRSAIDRQLQWWSRSNDKCLLRIFVPARQAPLTGRSEVPQQGMQLTLQARSRDHAWQMHDLARSLYARCVSGLSHGLELNY